MKLDLFEVPRVNISLIAPWYRLKFRKGNRLLERKVLDGRTSGYGKAWVGMETRGGAEFACRADCKSEFEEARLEDGATHQ
jgi:hypothetical protein